MRARRGRRARTTSRRWRWAQSPSLRATPRWCTPAPVSLLLVATPTVEPVCSSPPMAGHPGNADRLCRCLVHVDSGEPFLNEHCRCSQQLRSIRSTDRGGAWSRKLPGVATSLVAEPGNFANQYAGVGYASDSADNGGFRSTDRGATWTRINGPWNPCRWYRKSRHRDLSVQSQRRLRKHPGFVQRDG